MSRISVVVGLAFGDEGKGSMVNRLTRESSRPLVIRFNGGAQAGHTVVEDGKRHVFSHFGAGTLSGARTYWSEYCYVEPGALITELKSLRSLGVTPQIDINQDAPVVTPYDMLANINCEDNLDHGTCGVGFGKAAKREEESPISIKFSDLMQSRWHLEEKIRSVAYYYGNPVFENLEVLLDKFYQFVEEIKEDQYIKEIKGLGYYSSTFCDHYIFEGSQGVLLDREYGYFPHVTRSKTTPLHAVKLIKEVASIDSVVDIYLMTRSYLTRHGNGPFPSSELKVDLINNENETNVYNKFQGDLRVGPIDLDLLDYSISKVSKDLEELDLIKDYTLCVTCMDQLEKFPIEGTYYSRELFMESMKIWFENDCAVSNYYNQVLFSNNESFRD